MGARGIDKNVEELADPKVEEFYWVGSLQPAFLKDMGDLRAVLGAERRRVEMKQSAIKEAHVVSGVRPRARARRTSCARRRVSARATDVPKGVIR